MLLSTGADIESDSYERAVVLMQTSPCFKELNCDKIVS